MTDRIKLNAPAQHKVYGKLDEVVIENCTVHIEQMSEDGFWIGISRGGDLLHVNIFKKGRYVHAKVEVQDGFDDMDVSQHG